LPYGNTTPPEGAPVAPPDLIGASLFIGLIAMLAIARQGAYLVSLLAGLTAGQVHALDVSALAGLGLNIGGFVASLWLLALRRWAWALGLGSVVIEIALRGYYAFADATGAAGRSHPDVLAAAGQAFLALVFLVLLGYLLGAETRALIRDRRQYRAAQKAARA
jgi:hypothetical protein